MFDSGSNGKRERDTIIKDYDTILRESALLTTFAGILFGFLLEISISGVSAFSFDDRITLLIALFSITIAASLFVMPVIYPHIQYPYKDLDKIKTRSHRFIVFGLIPAGVTMYLGLELALSSIIEKFPSFVLATIPFLLVIVLFRLRK